MKQGIKPIILTAGDPSGVGPEIAVQAFSRIRDTHPFAVLGDVEQLRSLADRESISTHVINNPSEIMPGSLCVISQDFSSAPEFGTYQPENAAGTISMIERAVGFVKDGSASAVVTNPINKNVLIKGANFPYPGHTEFLAKLDQKAHSVMLLASPELFVVPVTIHIPLLDVPTHLTDELLTTTIRTVNSALRVDFAIEEPRIWIAGLNPHAGEAGQMGDEEMTLIGPVIDRLKNDGINLSGPMSADTMFHAQARQNYDVAICMYHDQALIPIKTIDFDRGVNATLGLSFIRTSPDHGTAYDIAGRGIANPTSLIEAIKLASKMARNRACS